MDIHGIYRDLYIYHGKNIKNHEKVVKSFNKFGKYRFSGRKTFGWSDGPFITNSGSIYREKWPGVLCFSSHRCPLGILRRIQRIHRNRGKSQQNGPMVPHAGEQDDGSFPQNSFKLLELPLSFRWGNQGQINQKWFGIGPPCDRKLQPLFATMAKQRTIDIPWVLL